ncbi:MAG: cupin domain-containing protein [Nocardioides sp.]|nr:cupin domain-containing protein [Nocardioides sp.]
MSNLNHVAGSDLLTPEGGYALRPADAPAWWAVGTSWRLLSTTTSSSGRSSTFDELVPPGIVAPPRVHENEEEAFFVLEGDLVFWLGGEEIEAPPGTYVHIPRGSVTVSVATRQSVASTTPWHPGASTTSSAATRPQLPASRCRPRASVPSTSGACLTPSVREHLGRTRVRPHRRRADVSTS